MPRPRPLDLSKFSDSSGLLRTVRAVDGLGGAVFAALWLAIALVECFVALLVKGGVYAIEFVCLVLDWIGAVY